MEMFFHASLNPNLFKALLKLSNFLKYLDLHIFMGWRGESAGGKVFLLSFLVSITWQRLSYWSRWQVNTKWAVD